MKEIKIATVCTGVGSPEQAMINLGFPHEISFACEIDKFPRQTYLANFNPNMMLEDMTKENWIGKEYYADLFIGGIPCQAFSLAGKRLGELDKRGLLFYDFYRYVKNQQPKYFIIENVKGLLSMKKGQVFENWKMLLGKSENGNAFLHLHDDSLEYNLHWKVLNTKKHGLPHNRERVFLVGIRKDLPNDFNFPRHTPLDKFLNDILEPTVDEKYFLNDNKIEMLLSNDKELRKKYLPQIDGNFLMVKSGKQHPYEVARPGDSINIEFPNSKTRRGRVGKSIAQTLTTSCNQVVMIGYTRDKKGKVTKRHEKEMIGTLTTATGSGGNTDQFVFDGFAFRKLTPLECFRAQGFPDHFKKPCSDSQLYKQAGNTISVNVIQAILKNLLKYE